MFKKKTTYFYIFFLLITISLTADDYRFEEASSWIKTIGIPSYEQKREDIINGEYYLLSDMQVRTDGNAFYNHYAILLANSTGLENNSQISIDFDPGYEELIIHNISVIRDGRKIDKGENAITSVIQKENELEKLLYNGTKTFFAILSDIRVNDILEISYTIEEIDPLFPYYSDRFYLEWAVPVKKLYRRIVTDDDLTYKFNNREITPESDRGGEYIWEDSDIPAIEYDEYVPYWFDAHNYLEVSQFTSWKQVSSLIAGFYETLQLSDEQALYIYSLYPGINEQSSNKSIIETLLNIVQEDIRYMGIEIGRGSYIPTAPYDVFTRKFGDCKDKSLLLSRLLNYKNIEAYPVLVHNSAGKDLINVLPSPYQFNHVIVKIIHDNEIFWIDPTFTYQEGSLENISEAPYEYGLVISDSGNDLEKIEPRFSGRNIVINETFTLPSEINDIGTYTIETGYYNEDADYMRSYLSNSPPAKVAEELSEYMEYYYDGLEISEEIQYNDDLENNIITLTEYYEIPKIWQYSNDEDNYQFIYSPYEIYNYTTEVENPDRTMPFNLIHPISISQNVTVILPEEWNISPVEEKFETDHYRYKRTIENEKKKLNLYYDYTSLEDSVPSEDFIEYNDSLKELGETIDYAVYWNPEIIDAEKDGSSKAGVITAPIIIAAYLIYYFVKRRKTINQIH